MTYQEQRELEIKTRVLLRNAANNAMEAYQLFKAMLEDDDELPDRVEIMKFAMNKIENIHEQIDGNDVEDLMAELQSEYCEKALAEFGESHNGYRSTSQMVDRVLDLRGEDYEEDRPEPYGGMKKSDFV